MIRCARSLTRPPEGTEVTSTAEHPRIIDARIPDSQKVAPKPPVPELTEKRYLRLAAPDGADCQLIHDWMKAPHVAPAWKQDWPLEQWHAHLSQMYDNTYERPYILEYDGEAVAYLELYRAARDVIADHYDAHAWDIGLHGAIGNIKYVGKTLGFRVWMDIIPALFRAEPQCRAVMTDPAVDNEMALRLDQGVANRIGGENLGEAQLPHKKAVLFRYSRAAFEAR